MGLLTSIGTSAQRLRDPVRYVRRHWIRHDELVRTRQQIRYLAIASIFSRTTGEHLDLLPYEMSVFSQNGEDGVLFEMLERIGTKSRTFVEIGASGNEANCLFLAEALGWSGVFFDADETAVTELRGRFASSERVQAKSAFLTSANINREFVAAGVSEEVDVLSIDVDGNDYWLWSAIDCRPRVVVVEVNTSLLPSSSYVQPYDENHRWDGEHSEFGAAIGALKSLAHKLGYRLAHVDLSGTNAFFVRTDVAGENFLEEDKVVMRVPNYFLYGLSHVPGPNRLVG